ncbi:prolipoprotein diacylglyceryl transferase [Halomonas elongata]|uniref:Phosphatidylglycerol--prolipoprotein diacylglyceryl transferase n=1 Tax=Halomonas elongata (strain ATCC 33173 / DSM 2581 / NBRC 15536 / NCIMB 2198 / 1H9) TaxID=768066 RepID=E1V821_HALED|nr:prolipoprotein diacylglyceryl transferase [Halomonas elongata]MBW5801401.1 prolipoprotein diacylglyceryl transferase [Halomonas elongata]MDL4862682.1 prolipoprotein diacylglyceryl transferase [Halomonas elongata]RAW07300.1 prolipoprotein diacylglyceryl transferase [Halomonas elongata]WBF18823.1 prolipoprotein diacylglyceryl transferase [Halomonas elongata]WPU47680.1 prolipoprotein diacylglyceryl transferase [Halomonas elongata DSM 2581]
MLTYPSIDPVAVSLGPFQVHWYGLMYVIGFIAAWWLGRQRAERIGLTRDDVGDLLFYGALGVVLGGRLGYALFYGLDQWLADPLWILRVWDGGMSFHGGLLGVLLASWIFARRKGLAFFTLTDFVAPLVPIGLGAGRIGNFINHELPGRLTDLPWGMPFPGMGPEPRHPSSLYEALLEGLVLFVVMWWVSAQPRRRGFVSGLFLVLYGVFRFAVEFVRRPDPQLGFIAFDWLTMGMLLSLPMILAGLLLMGWSRRQPTP